MLRRFCLAESGLHSPPQHCFNKFELYQLYKNSFQNAWIASSPLDALFLTKYWQHGFFKLFLLISLLLGIIYYYLHVIWKRDKRNSGEKGGGETVKDGKRWSIDWFTTWMIVKFVSHTGQNQGSGASPGSLISGRNSMTQSIISCLLGCILSGNWIQNENKITKRRLKWCIPI